MAHDLPSVIFPGWVDAPRIAALMEMSCVGLAPYAKNTRMSLPNKPFEYFSGSLPVVSSIQGELKALLEEHECGLTYEADSVDALSGILRKLYKDRALCSQMGARGRGLVDRQFSSAHIGRELSEHLSRVVANYHRQGSHRP
jgi:glycosyltransferase involved in cell wall biosynthesis